jgi:hypothetical protein
VRLGGADRDAQGGGDLDLVTHLGYPSYFLVLLGSWKVLAALALLIPRLALLKEWAYAGACFVYTGAIVSHLTTGYDLGEVALLAVLTMLTVLSWALRPPSRRTHRHDSAVSSRKDGAPAGRSRRWKDPMASSGARATS